MNRFAKTVCAVALSACTSLVLHLPLAHAADAHVHAADAMSEGEIRKVDKENGKLTIRHGELKNLQMPAMTMVFRVKDRGMLDAVKTGDKVAFVAEDIGGQLTVTEIQTK
ncbi:copper-binding protein [Oxalobacteraceae bacterium OM1]|nr:copper-binding protein [Oxalobacteraceae bacterium OM1]